MHFPIRRLALSTAIFAVYAHGSLAVDPPSPPNYRSVNLGTPLGGKSAKGISINSLEWVVGQASMAGDASIHAELWMPDKPPVDLGTLGGPNSAVAWPNRNDRGEIAGIAETSAIDQNGEDWSCGSAVFPSVTHHVCVGFVWKDGKMRALPTLGGTNGFATGINNAGQVVGWAENTTHDPTCSPASHQVLQFEAVIWGTDGNPQVLPPYSGDVDGAATAINQKGQVVGISGICDQAVGRFSAAHAVMWDHGQVIALGGNGSLGGKAWNTPMDINDRGDVVGFSDLAGDDDGTPNFHAFFWTEGRPMQDLGTLAGNPRSIAFSVNDNDQVVGQSAGHAFIWQNGTLTDLNTLLAPGAALVLVSAKFIDDKGVIVGSAFDPATGTNPAFKAYPMRGQAGKVTYRIKEGETHDATATVTHRR